MSSGHAVQIYVALVCDLVLYGLACLVASAATVLAFIVGSGLGGVGPGLAAIPVLVVFGTMTTFIYALPASALLIGIGEWCGYGRAYYVLAGMVSALLSFGFIFGVSPISNFPWPELIAVAVGGLAGGAVFGHIHAALRKHY